MLSKHRKDVKEVPHGTGEAVRPRIDPPQISPVKSWSCPGCGSGVNVEKKWSAGGWVCRCYDCGYRWTERQPELTVESWPLTPLVEWPEEVRERFFDALLLEYEPCKVEGI